MKNKKVTIFMIVLLIISIILLTGILTNFLLNKGKGFFINIGSSVSNNKVIDRVYEQNIQNINIDSTSSNIEIKNGEQFRVVIYGDINRVKTDMTGDTLTIVSHEKECNFICFNKKVFKVELYIPKEYDKNITIHNKYGDIFVDGFSYLDLDVKINYGDINILELDKVNIDSDYGDIEIGKANDIIIDSNYGDVKIGTVLGHLNIKEDCGDIKINSLNIKEDSIIENNLGDVEIGNTNEIFISAKTNLGDTKINNNYNKSDITLTINNSLGDISIKN